MRRSSIIKWGLALLLLVALMIVPTFVTQPYILNIFILIFYMATCSMSWFILGGLTGQNSIGHAAFMGLGAYISSLLITKADVNPWVSLIVAIVGTAVIAVVIFYPSFILRGPYFTLVTIAMGETFRNFMLTWEYGGRASGVLLPFGEDSFLYLRFLSKIPYYYVGLVMMILAYFFIRWIDKSKLGFALKTIREDEDVANTVGIYPLKYKLIAIACSMALIAIAGFFYASYYRYIDPAIMTQNYSVEYVLPAIIGGIQSVNGSILGAFILVPLGEVLRNEFGHTLPGLNLFVYALALILIIRFMPSGIIGTYNKSRLKKWVDEKILKVDTTSKKGGKKK